MNQKLTPDEQEFIQKMESKLPPIIARKAVGSFLGGIVAPQTLTNADCNQTGPAGAYKVGRNVSYDTRSLLEWIVLRLGVAKLNKFKDL